jgi:murein DD-endopeptidase MepM/ murein hydrolase activator NlpD
VIFPLLARPILSYHEPPRSFGAPRGKKPGTVGSDRRHAGCDLYAPKGTPILAVADGTVTHHSTKFYRPTDDAPYVGALEVWHPGLGKVRYAEIDRPADGIDVHSKVLAGQVIAYVGQVAGMAHAMLHFELYAGTADGPLTNETKKPFERRADLRDPTAFLDECQEVTNDAGT